MQYRSEIDGLRALAVIAVMLFHAGFSSFSGGFVGVDVFFVISGYLITSIILLEKQSGTFTLAGFYERRARRILPALFFVMLVCLPFAWLWLLPTHMKAFSQSIMSVTTFVSNFFFWSQSGYFDTAADLKPLLHTWSLAVEEQYYVLFPLFVMATWSLKRKWVVGLLVIIALISLGFAHWGAMNKPAATFFLLPARVWELLLGALAAFHMLNRERNGKDKQMISEPASLLGILLIVYAVVTFNEKTLFPSLYALVPTIGALLIIVFAHRDTVVGRVLGSKWLVTFGLLSYSAYLWHQPIFAFARHRSIDEPGKLLMMGLIVISFVLAYFSWRYVETPFRNKQFIDKKKLCIGATVATVVFFSIGMIGHFTDGFQHRMAHDADLIAEIDYKLRPNFGLNEVCEDVFTLSPKCRTSDEPDVMVWGDSFAMHLVQGLIASNPDIKLIQMTKSACGPFFDVGPIQQRPDKQPEEFAQDCLDFNHQVREYLQSHQSIKYVVMASVFDQYLLGQKLLIDGKVLDANDELVLNELNSTLQYLESLGVKPVIFAPPPNSVNNEGNLKEIGQCLANASKFNKPLDSCDFERSTISQSREVVYQFLRKVETNYRVVWLDDVICDRAMCRTHIGSTFIYRDTGHLSHEGSAMLGQQNQFAYFRF